MEGRFLGTQPAVPLLTALGRGHRAAVKPDVHRPSLAEQEWPGWGHLCQADARSCSPTSWPWLFGVRHSSRKAEEMLQGGSILLQGWMWGDVPRKGLLQRFVGPWGWRETLRCQGAT